MRVWKAGCVMAAVVLLATGCGEGPSTREEVAEVAAAASADSPIVQQLPERDNSDVDVCALLPVQRVSEATGLAATKPAAPLPPERAFTPGCIYELKSGSYEEPYEITLVDPGTFKLVREAAESFGRGVTDVEGLGAAAYIKEETGGGYTALAARADGLVVKVMGFEREPTLAAVRVALEQLP